jgi:hypothetical protein
VGLEFWKTTNISLLPQPILLTHHRCACTHLNVVTLGCRKIFCINLGEYDGQVMLVGQTEADCVRMWKLNEAQKFEIWRELRTKGLTKGVIASTPFVIVNNSGLIMVIDWEINISIFNSKGKLIVRKMRLPGLRTSQRPIRGTGSAFESNNLWWPESLFIQ